MTLFERSFILMQPLFPVLYRKVRGIVKEEIRRNNRNANVALLDIGGRKSHYTIGIGANVTVSDLPRRTLMQSELNLGINNVIIEQFRNRRSNVESVVYDDMARTDLPANSFDLIVAVEVLEHVEEDEAFIRNVYKTLRKGGVFFMTTPHGDFVPNKNPDHKRHYSQVQLGLLLQTSFDAVETWGDVRGGRFRRWGLPGWSLRHPIRTLKSMAGNAINYYESLSTTVEAKSLEHLFARCQK
jgi:SAM-dependent methyltransferase